VVAPSDDVSLTIPATDDTSDDRVYTVENAVADAEHQIVLAEAANVIVTGDTVTIAETGSLNGPSS